MNATTTLLAQKSFEGNPSPTLNYLQRLLEPHLSALVGFWIVLWAATAAYVLYILIRSYMEHWRRKEGR